MYVHNQWHHLLLNNLLGCSQSFWILTKDTYETYLWYFPKHCRTAYCRAKRLGTLKGAADIVQYPHETKTEKLWKPKMHILPRAWAKVEQDSWCCSSWWRSTMGCSCSVPSSSTWIYLGSRQLLPRLTWPLRRGIQTNLSRPGCMGFSLQSTKLSCFGSPAMTYYGEWYLVLGGRNP